MVDRDRYGTSWSEEELDAIVASYFAMLEKELAREPYVKARNTEALMKRLGRSHRSVEFKNQNISAVLDVLGLAWVPGYRPKANYQNAIFDAIDRYLTCNPSTLGKVVATPPSTTSASSLFVPAPVRSVDDEPLPPRLQRLARKFDPVERDNRNRILGNAGEDWVVRLEQQKLKDAGLKDLARKVRWVSQEDGDGAGYDILSYTLTGNEHLIEVKTTNGSAKTPFFLTRNERAVASERAKDWRIYRVHFFSTDPRVFVLAAPLDEVLNLSPETWRASF